MGPKDSNEKTPARAARGSGWHPAPGREDYDPSPFNTITAVLQRMKKSNSRPQLRT